MAVRPVTATTTDTTRLDTGIIAGITLNKSVAAATGLDPQSTKTAGFAKAISIYYKLLFTEKGTNPLNAQEGTSLPTLYQSNITDLDTLFVDVSNDVTDAFTQLSDIQNRNNATAEEKIVGVDIIDFRTTLPDAGAAASGTRLDFSLLFRNAAGEKSPYQLPSIVLS
jgi:hypothetical protein